MAARTASISRMSKLRQCYPVYGICAISLARIGGATVCEQAMFSNLKALTVTILRVGGGNRFHRARTTALCEFSPKFDGAYGWCRSGAVLDRSLHNDYAADIGGKIARCTWVGDFVTVSNDRTPHVGQLVASAVIDEARSHCCDMTPGSLSVHPSVCLSHVHSSNMWKLWLVYNRNSKPNGRGQIHRLAWPYGHRNVLEAETFTS